MRSIVDPIPEFRDLRQKEYKMKLLFSATNALNKWLKADLPRLPAKEGQRAGVHALASDDHTCCWQVHIIDNAYKSRHKTIIACEANSRFIVFIPVEKRLSLDELSERLLMEWQHSLADTLSRLSIMQIDDIACFIYELSQHKFDIIWAKNTDLSINGHISDAGSWLNQTLEQEGQASLAAGLNSDLSLHLNTQMKRAHQGREQFMPLVILMDYCEEVLIDQQQLPAKPDLASATNTASASAAANSTLVGSNIVQLSDYKK
jgi:hypothetical protein